MIQHPRRYLADRTGPFVLGAVVLNFVLSKLVEIVELDVARLALVAVGLQVGLKLELVPGDKVKRLNQSLTQ